MKNKGQKLKAEARVDPSAESVSAGQEPVDTPADKKKTLIEKCDSLSEAVLDHKNTYLQIMSAIAGANSKIVEDVQSQIRALKENISGPEKKKFKKARLADELGDLQKSAKKLGLKPELGRKKDLDRFDDYLLRTFRILDSLNDKFLNGHKSSEHSQT